MKSHAVLATLLFVPFVSSCYAVSWISGSGRIVSEERTVSEFHSVDLQGTGILYVAQGEQQKVVVTTDDNIMPVLRTDVTNGRLAIRTEPGVRRITRLELRVTMVNVSRLDLSGSGRIEGLNQIRSDRIHIGISGSGDASLDIMAKEVTTKSSGSGRMSLHLDSGSLESRISGSGKLTLAGETTTHRYHTSGSGKLHAFDLLTENTFARITGSGSCEVSVSRNLDVRVSGSGNVRYRGNPRIESRISGSGSIRSAE